MTVSNADPTAFPVGFTVPSAARYITVFEQLWRTDSGPTAAAETGVDFQMFLLNSGNSGSTLPTVQQGTLFC